LTEDAKVRFSRQDDKLVCFFEGALNTARCAEVEEKVLQEVGRAGVPVVFDVAAVDYVASAFLRICVAANRKAGAGRFGIVNPQPSVKKVFMISGLQGLLA
jgi:anti-anti-sigma factor